MAYFRGKRCSGKKRRKLKNAEWKRKVAWALSPKSHYDVPVIEPVLIPAEIVIPTTEQVANPDNLIIHAVQAIDCTSNSPQS